MHTAYASRLQKIIFTRSLVSAVVLLFSFGLTISLLHMFAFRSSQSPGVTVVTSPTAKTEAILAPTYSPPLRLEIANISVNNPVVATGLTQNGAMDIGENIAKTAWYKLGPRPGEKGSAVIAGHYGWKDGQASVFNNLHSLQRGDTVSVYDDKEVGLDFIVKEIRKYNFDADATEVFGSSDGKAHLNLITCNGAWNNALQTYSDRLVVFTDLKLRQ